MGVLPGTDCQTMALFVKVSPTSTHWDLCVLLSVVKFLYLSQYVSVVLSCTDSTVYCMSHETVRTCILYS